MCGNCWVNKGLASGEIPLACVMKGFVGRQKLMNPSGAIQGATRGGRLAVINWRTLLGSPALTIVLPLPVALPVWPLLCPLAWPMLLPPASPVWPILLPLVLPISPLPVALPVWPCPLSRHCQWPCHQAKMRKRSSSNVAIIHQCQYTINDHQCQRSRHSTISVVAV